MDFNQRHIHTYTHTKSHTYTHSRIPTPYTHTTPLRPTLPSHLSPGSTALPKPLHMQVLNPPALTSANIYSKNAGTNIQRCLSGLSDTSLRFFPAQTRTWYILNPSKLQKFPPPALACWIDCTRGTERGLTAGGRELRGSRRLDPVFPSVHEGEGESRARKNLLLQLCG